MPTPPDQPPSDVSSLAALFGPDWQADVETIRYVVARVAVELGERPEPVLKEVDRNTPAGRVIVKLLNLAQPTPRRGRKADIDTRRYRAKEAHRAFAEVSDDARRSGKPVGLPELRRRTAALLFTRGIKGNGHDPRPLNQRTVQELIAETALIYFVEPDQ